MTAPDPEPLEDRGDFEVPDAVLVNRRWVPQSTVDWVHQADEIIREHGMVNGTVRYEARHQARWRAQRLIKYLVSLEIYERWQLAEHTSRVQGGWMWTVEYVGGR